MSSTTNGRLALDACSRVARRPGRASYMEGQSGHHREAFIGIDSPNSRNAAASPKAATARRAIAASSPPPKRPHVLLRGRALLGLEPSNEPVMDLADRSRALLMNAWLVPLSPSDPLSG